jgi:hypothetical protein
VPGRKQWLEPDEVIWLTASGVMVVFEPKTRLLHADWLRAAGDSAARIPLQPVFDPYHKWLGIPPKDQPPNHYRLLGLEPFESDVEVIEAAANRQMGYVQQRATGKNAAISQKLLNELSAARVCLLDSRKRAVYDVELRTRMSSPPAEDLLCAVEPEEVEPPPAKKPDTVLSRAQQAYDIQNYEGVIKLLETQPVDGADPQVQQLLESARFSLDQIRWLSQELDVAWKQKNVKRVSKIASELISLQPAHRAANEAIRWATLAYWQFYDVRRRGKL